LNTVYSEGAGPILEREEQLAVLLRHFQIASRAVGQFVAIGAEAGLGKSRLLDEFRNALPVTAQFLWGQAFAATRSNSYSVWVDALDIYLRSLEPGLCRRLLGDSPDLRRLFAAASMQSVDGGPPAQAAAEGALMPAADHGERVTSLFGNMAAMLTRMAQLSPVVIVLDNLHWADASSIKMLHALIRSLRDCRVLLVMLYRHDDPSMPPLLTECLSALESIGQVVRLGLAPLSLKAAQALLSSGFDDQWEDEAVELLHVLTQGNPLYIREYMTYARTRNDGRPLEPQAIRGMVPDTVEALIRERLRGLGDDVRRTLAVAAVIEARISYSLVGDVLRLEEEKLLAAFDQLTGMGLLREVVAGAEVAYEFHKPLIQAAVYQSLGEARRRYLHKLVAIELQNQAGGKMNSAQLARHLLAGEDIAQKRLALPHLLHAAREAVAVFGNNEAVNLLRQALDVMDEHDAPQVSRVDLLLNLGESHKRLGQFSQAVSAWSEGLRVDTVTIEQRADLRRCIARTQWQSGDAGAAMKTLLAGLEDNIEAAGRPGLALQQEYALACVRQGKLDGAWQKCEALLKERRLAHEPEILARVFIVEGMVSGYRGEMQKAHKLLDEAIAISSQIHYPGAVFLACYTAAAFMRYCGNEERFEAMCAQCDAIAERMHAVALSSWPDSIRVEFHTRAGRCHNAVAAGQRALKVDEAIAQGSSLPRTHAFLAVAQYMLGDKSLAHWHLAQARQWAEPSAGQEPRALFTLGLCEARLEFLEGNYARALERINSAVALLDDIGPLPFYLLHPYALPLAAEAAARASRPEEARRLCSRIRELRHAELQSAQGAIDLVEGILCRLHGDPASAHRHIQAAICVWSASGQSFDRWRACAELAAVLEECGQKDKAVSMLRDTEKAFRSIGAVREAAGAAEKLRSLGVRQARTVQSGAVDQPLSRRELEVVSLLRHGMTNKEVAARLFLSELTIETHVKNILRKLALKSRVQIAAYAVQHQIGDGRRHEARADSGVSVR
jgi:DNA-binding CsgD family transcriptional regulator